MLVPWELVWCLQSIRQCYALELISTLTSCFRNHFKRRLAVAAQTRTSGEAFLAAMWASDVARMEHDTAYISHHFSVYHILLVVRIYLLHNHAGHAPRGITLLPDLVQLILVFVFILSVHFESSRW